MNRYNVFAFLLAISVLFSCEKSMSINDGLIPLKQFADGIINFSSEYSSAPGPWSSFVVLGNPDTYPEYGDFQTAWASKTKDDEDEYLIVSFDTSQYVNHLEIYETYNPGAVVSIELRNMNNGGWKPIYTEKVEINLEEKSRIMNIEFPKTSYLVDAVRIKIDSRKVKGWNEIDAISINGFIEE